MNSSEYKVKTKRLKKLLELLAKEGTLTPIQFEELNKISDFIADFEKGSLSAS